MVYSEGFNPRARVSFGLALPTGYESDAEYIDVRIDVDRAEEGLLTTLPERLNAVLPEGLVVTGSALLANKTPSLQEAVTSCEWDITLMNTTHDEANAWVGRILAADTLLVERERKGKPSIDDLRPSIHSLAVLDDLDDEGHVHVHTRLGNKPRAVRPAELLIALEPSPEALRVRRLTQLIDRDGARLEPLQDGPVGAAPEAQNMMSAP